MRSARNPVYCISSHPDGAKQPSCILHRNRRRGTGNSFVASNKRENCLCILHTHIRISRAGQRASANSPGKESFRNLLWDEMVQEPTFSWRLRACPPENPRKTTASCLIALRPGFIPVIIVVMVSVEKLSSTSASSTEDCEACDEIVEHR